MGKFYTTEFSSHAELDFITVKSNALNRRADLTIYNPLKSNLALKSLPIVILLHGVYGSHWAWSLKGRAHKTVERLMESKDIKPLILVMPSDGLYGDGSAYVKHTDANYEKWIVEDVPNVVKEIVDQVDDDSPIFISGLSMGGYGALRLGAKYPQIFKAFSGLSSITHFKDMEMFVSNFQEIKKSAVDQDGVIDWMIKNKAVLPPFRFDCGAQDILINQNRALKKELIQAEIIHTYEEFSGGHNWDYWKKHIEKTLLFFNDTL